MGHARLMLGYALGAAMKALRSLWACVSPTSVFSFTVVLWS